MTKNSAYLRLLLVIGIAAGVANADPIVWNIDFTDGSPLPASGSFTYDASTATFSDFLVSSDGQVFDLTASANAPDVRGNPCGGLTGAAASFAFLADRTDQCAAMVYDVNWFETAITPGTESFGFEGSDIPAPVPYNSIEIFVTHSSESPAETFGNWTTSVASPEPSTAFMALISGAYLVRRRILGVFRMHRRRLIGRVGL